MFAVRSVYLSSEVMPLLALGSTLADDAAIDARFFAEAAATAEATEADVADVIATFEVMWPDSICALANSR